MRPWKSKNVYVHTYFILKMIKIRYTDFTPHNITHSHIPLTKNFFYCHLKAYFIKYRSIFTENIYIHTHIFKPIIHMCCMYEFPTELNFVESFSLYLLLSFFPPHISLCSKLFMHIAFGSSIEKHQHGK